MKEYTFHGLIHRPIKENNGFELYELLGKDGVTKGFTILRNGKFVKSCYSLSRGLELIFNVLNIGKFKR